MRERFWLRFGRGVGSPSDGGTDTTTTSDGGTTDAGTDTGTGTDAETSTDGRGVG